MKSSGNEFTSVWKKRSIKNLLQSYQLASIWTVEGQKSDGVHIFFTISGYQNNYATVWEWKGLIHMPKGTAGIQ